MEKYVFKVFDEHKIVQGFFVKPGYVGMINVRTGEIELITSGWEQTYMSGALRPNLYLYRYHREAGGMWHGKWESTSLYAARRMLALCKGYINAVKRLNGGE